MVTGRQASLDFFEHREIIYPQWTPAGLDQIAVVRGFDTQRTEGFIDHTGFIRTKENDITGFSLRPLNKGGHNGLRDISKALATKDYLRVRVGVGRPPGRMDTADYVLRDFATAEKKELPFLLDESADAVELLISQGLLAAQQKHHPAKA